MYNSGYAKRNMYSKGYSKKTAYKSRSTGGFRGMRNTSYRKPVKQEVKTFDSILYAGTNINNSNGFQLDFTNEAQKLTAPELGTGFNQRIGDQINNLYHNIKFTLHSAAIAADDSETSSGAYVDTVTVGQQDIKGTQFTPGFNISAPSSTGAHGEAIDEMANDFNMTVDDDSVAPTRRWEQIQTDKTVDVNLEAKGRTDKMNYAHKMKFVRTQHRVIIFKDKEERSDAITVNETVILEPGKAGVNMYPCVLSNYNTRSFGRFNILYDKVHETDSDDPYKTVILNNFKSAGSQRFGSSTGSGAVAARSGSLHILYIATIPGTYDLDQAPCQKPEVQFSIRQRYTE